MTIQPINDLVLVSRLDVVKQTSGGLFIPDVAVEKQLHATVEAVGPGKLLENGSRVPPEVRVGDRVLLSKWGQSDVVVDGKTVTFIREGEILGVIEEA